MEDALAYLIKCSFERHNQRIICTLSILILLQLQQQQQKSHSSSFNCILNHTLKERVYFKWLSSCYLCGNVSDV